MKQDNRKRIDRARKERQQRFLAVLAEKGQTLSSAAISAGITRQLHHAWMKTDPGYRGQFERILEEDRPDFGSRVGRPSEYRAAIIQEICSAVSDGMPFAHAAAVAGVSQRTFCEWQEQFLDFAGALVVARAKGVQACLRVVLEAAERGDVSAAQWWLTHVCPEHFASKDFGSSKAGLLAGNSRSVLEAPSKEGT